MKLYVLVRKDMTPSQQAVQGGHAVAEFLLRCSQSWSNETLIYLGVKGELQLKKWIHKLSHINVKFASWREPDMDNQVTAIATCADESMFKNLNLL